MLCGSRTRSQPSDGPWFHPSFRKIENGIGVLGWRRDILQDGQELQSTRQKRSVPSNLSQVKTGGEEVHVLCWKHQLLRACSQLRVSGNRQINNKGHWWTGVPDYANGDSILKGFFDVFQCSAPSFSKLVIAEPKAMKISDQYVCFISEKRNEGRWWAQKHYN